MLAGDERDREIAFYIFVVFAYTHARIHIYTHVAIRNSSSEQHMLIVNHVCVCTQRLKAKQPINPKRSHIDRHILVCASAPCLGCLIARRTAPRLGALIARQTPAPLRSQCWRQELRRTFRLQHRHWRPQLQRNFRLPELRPQLLRTLKMFNVNCVRSVAQQMRRPQLRQAPPVRTQQRSVTGLGAAHAGTWLDVRCAKKVMRVDFVMELTAGRTWHIPEDTNDREQQSGGPRLLKIWTLPIMLTWETCLSSW